MITLIRHGDYELAMTKSGQKLLMLDHDPFIWLRAKKIGDLLEYTSNDHEVDAVLCDGEFRLYQVDDEPQLVDTLHLELEIGQDKWQGYLLITGVPTEQHKRARIIATDECIATKTTNYRKILFSDRDSILLGGNDRNDLPMNDVKEWR